MNHYTAAVGKSLTELADEVNDYVIKGYKPVGGILVSSLKQDSQRWYIQAVFLDEDKDEKNI